MRQIDLRSDTVTHPTPAMRRAMAEAEVGDDGWGDDPTMNRLQERVAEMLGKEAAVFVPSGTMANLASVLSHCERGDEIIVGDQSHVYLYEYGSVSALGGVGYRQLPNAEDGTLDPGMVEEAIRPASPRFPRTALVCLENTHNRCSGAALTPGVYGRHSRSSSSTRRSSPPGRSAACSTPPYTWACPRGSWPAPWTPSCSASPRVCPARLAP